MSSQTYESQEGYENALTSLLLEKKMPNYDAEAIWFGELALADVAY